MSSHVASDVTSHPNDDQCTLTYGWEHMGPTSYHQCSSILTDRQFTCNNTRQSGDIISHEHTAEKTQRGHYWIYSDTDTSFTLNCVPRPHTFIHYSSVYLIFRLVLTDKHSMLTLAPLQKIMK